METNGNALLLFLVSNIENLLIKYFNEIWWYFYSISFYTEVRGHKLDKIVVLFVPHGKTTTFSSQGLSHDWEITSPKNIIRKCWVCKIFPRCARNSISYNFTSFATFWATFVAKMLKKHTKLHKKPQNLPKKSALKFKIKKTKNFCYPSTNRKIQ